jgi:hypothetical protein
LNVPIWVVSDQAVKIIILGFAKQAEKMLKSLLRQSAHQLDLNRDLAEVIAIVGELNAKLGEASAAIESFKRAMAARETYMHTLTPGDEATRELSTLTPDCLRFTTLQSSAGRHAEAMASAAANLSTNCLPRHLEPVVFARQAGILIDRLQRERKCSM